MFKLSIITVNYNNLEGLKKTVKSVLHQTWKEFEYIVIDGGSTDGSKDFIESQRDKIDYWVSEQDKGIYNAMNKGIKAASGEYLLFLNSGDVLIDNPNILNFCKEKLQEDIVAFDCFLEKENKVVGRRAHIEKPTLFYVIQYGFKHQSTFIKKSLFEKLGLYNEFYKIASDYEFWIRCFLDSSTTSKSYNNPLAVFQLNGISQNGGWGEEHQLIEQELLPHLITDYKKYQELLPYQNSRILTTIIKLQKFITKIIP